MDRYRWLILLSTCLLFVSLSGCTFNPLSENNHLTGSPIGVVAGGAAGAGIASALGVKTNLGLGLAGLGGASVGYYATTLRFASAGIIQAGGQVYQVGDYVTIEIPSDQLFDPNTADLQPSAGEILKSVVNVLNRYPDHNIMVSGNTSGFGSRRWEQKLSEDRARQVASFLWAEGIQSIKNQSNDTRCLTFVGYGNYFPIANHVTNEGIRANSRIQITVYPTKEQLLITKKAKVFSNISGMDNEPHRFYTVDHWNKTFPASEILPEVPSTQTDFRNEYVLTPHPAIISGRNPQSSDYYKEQGRLTGDAWRDQNIIIGDTPPPPKAPVLQNPAQQPEAHSAPFGGYKGEGGFKGE